MTREANDANNMQGWHASNQSSEFAIDQLFKAYGLVTGLEAEAGGLAREVDLEPGEEWTQAKYHAMNERYQRQVFEELTRLSNQEQPFFLQYWPLYPLNFVHDSEQNQTRNGGFIAEKLQLLDRWMGEILAKVDELGVAENTIVLFMADNGIFRQYSGPSA